MRRIVVTGMGVVSPLGCGVETSWARLLEKKSGIRLLPPGLADDVPVRIGPVPHHTEDAEAGFTPDVVVSPKDQRKMDRFILFALAAAQEAITTAGWHPTTAEERDRTATVIASRRWRVPGHCGCRTNRRQPWCSQAFAVHHSVLPRQSRGGPYHHHAWVQRSDRHPRHSLCSQRAGLGGCGANDLDG